MAERDARAKSAKPEQFFDGTILKETEESVYCEAVLKIDEVELSRLHLARVTLSGHLPGSTLTKPNISNS